MQILVNILSIRVDNAVVVRVGLAMCGRRKNEYIKPRKIEMSVSMSYFSRFALKSPNKSFIKSFSNRFGR